MFINFKTNEMQKPTYQEIEDAASRAFQICIETRTFKNGFKTAIKWLLDWQKSQELQIRCHCGEIEIQPHTCPYKEDINDDSETICNCCSVCRKNCAD